MKRFLPDLKKGTPVGSKGVREGLLRMAKAFERMGVYNGRVQWANGIPTIIVGMEETDEPEVDFDYPGRVYKDADGDINVTEIPVNFWDGDEWDSTTKLEDGSYFGALTDEYVYIELGPYWNPGYRWHLAHGADDPLDDDIQGKRFWVLAYIDSDGNITQHWMGAIYEIMTTDYPGRVYKDSDGNINVTEIPLNFWDKDHWNSTTKSKNFGALTCTYIYIRLDISSGVDWTLNYYWDPLSGDSQTQRSWILAGIDADGTITQHWMGAIYETMGG